MFHNHFCCNWVNYNTNRMPLSQNMQPFCLCTWNIIRLCAFSAVMHSLFPEFISRYSTVCLNYIIFVLYTVFVNVCLQLCVLTSLWLKIVLIFCCCINSVFMNCHHSQHKYYSVTNTDDLTLNFSSCKNILSEVAVYMINCYRKGTIMCWKHR